MSLAIPSLMLHLHTYTYTHTHAHTHLMKSAISRRSLPAFVFPEGSRGTPRADTHRHSTHNVTPTLNSTRQSSVKCGIGAREPGCLRPKTKHANASLHLQEPIHTRASGRAHTPLHTHTPTHTLSLTHAVRHGMEEAAAVPRLPHNFC